MTGLSLLPCSDHDSNHDEKQQDTEWRGHPLGDVAAAVAARVEAVKVEAFLHAKLASRTAVASVLLVITVAVGPDCNVHASATGVSYGNFSPCRCGNAQP